MKFDTQTTTRDVNAAMELWQAFEYLSPQPPPKAERARNVCVWAIPCNCQGDAEMPWVSRSKQDDLARLFKAAPEQRQFVLYAGILPGGIYTNATREILGAAVIDDEEGRSPSDAASLVLFIDSNGYVTGQPFISSTPWALGSLAMASNHSGRFNFRGFFGVQGAEKRLTKELRELLVKLTLIPEPCEDDKGPATVGELLQKALSETRAECQAKRLTADETNVALQKATAKVRASYRTVCAEDIQALTKAVFSRLGWTPSEEGRWIMETKFLSKKELDDPLNSFFAEDLEKVQSAIIAGNFGSTLKQFLSNQESPVRVDLDKDKETLIAGVHPSRLPLAAWPGAFPLVTAQQFAVNMIHSELAEAGLYSVNGPPGTGKTTMLKDIVASVVQQRADKLMTFKHPDDAFKSKLTIENYQYHTAWRLDPSLCGFGIVVSSANNGAVENISRELPVLSAIDKNIKLDYFSSVSDSLPLGKGQNRPQVPQTWGLISAALGNAGNRSTFVQNFWWGDKESKKLADGSPNPYAPMPLQDWITEHGHTVPSWKQAKERYQQARAKAINAIGSASDLVNKMQKRSELQNALCQLQQTEATLRQSLTDAEAHLQEVLKTLNITNAGRNRIQIQYALAQALHTATNTLQQVQAEQVAHQSHGCAKDSALVLEQKIEAANLAERNAQTNFNNHLGTKPGFLSRLVFRGAAREWDSKSIELQAVIDQAQKATQAAQLAKNIHRQWLELKERLVSKHRDAQGDVTAAHESLISEGFDPNIPLYLVEDTLSLSIAFKNTLEAQVHDAKVRARHEQAALQSVVARHKEANSELITLESELAQHPTDHTRKAWNLRDLNRDEFHKASPYQEGGDLFSARRELFVAALELHQSFIVESWKKIKPTLAAFTNLLNGQINASRIDSGPMALWDTFFLTIPLISTSFASFPRLFKGVGAEDLAWSLIDEAGQATPQQALGAIWRSKRSVIVGDPIQLEPLVSLPKELIEPLKRYCATPDKYVPPGASAQTIADRSSRYGTFMGEEDPDTAIWLGSPLTVHRRCLNPMFDIANSIAYEGKMVYGTADDPQFQAPSSRWIDANINDAQGHWIPSQGHIVLNLVKQLTGNKVAVNGNFCLYVITPFKRVALNMRMMLEPVVGKNEAAKMCGTVHTFQGKEADYVIFLLGGDPNMPGVISSFAGRKPNLVNVAVTRAKKCLYVVGNRNFWTSSNDSKGYYRTMSKHLGR